MIEAVILKGITLVVAHFRGYIHELISCFRVIFKQFFLVGGVPVSRFVRLKLVCLVITYVTFFLWGDRTSPSSL